MNKNTEVIAAEYDTVLNGFSQIFEVLNIDFAPLIVKKRYEQNPDDLAKTLSLWFRRRGIPTWRDQLDLLLTRLGIHSPEELLDKSFGLSLADQYWLKPEGSDIKYDDINFFDHDFDTADFLEASFSNSSKSRASEASLHSPNNTTDGMLRKSWVIENGTRYLLKGGYKGDALQPFNEVLAAKICERLGFSHVSYELAIVKDKVVSKCACFTDKNIEIVPAYQVLEGSAKHQTTEDYEEYVKILEEAGIKDARMKLENMIVLDFLIMNEDRHLNNFGIVRDVNTLKWLDTTPIFDNGQALNILSYEDGKISISDKGRFFYDMESFDDMLGLVRDLWRFEFEKLDGVAEEFRTMLKEHQETSGIPDGRIEALCTLLGSRIERIKRLQKERSKS